MNYLSRIACLALIILPQYLFAQAIAEARTQPTGTTVTVRGMVTSGAELGKIRYLQDGTAGIAAYPGTGSAAGFEANVQPGDSIEVTGTLTSYLNLLEITPITAYTVISSGNPVPAAKVVALNAINESLESQLVQINCVSFSAGGGTFTSSGTYDISDTDGDLAKIYLRSGHPLIATPIPAGGIQLTAIVSQFGDYQLLPRTTTDFATAPCFYLTEKLTQSDITINGFSLTWASNLPASTVLRYGISTSLGQEVMASGTTTDHTVTLSGLQPGTLYWAQAVATHNNETIQSDIVPFATRSTSSGTIEVYFNHAVNTQFLGSQTPNGITGQACLDAVINHINAAQQTIDVAMYNNNRTDLVAALTAAHARGVRVRYVAALDASSSALEPNVPFPVVYGNDIAIMHNKFLAIDADLPDKAWVMSGSMNWTNSMIFTDFNNTVFIQDQSLARGYELEFEEMWGSDGALPNPANQRFGSLKRDNTPHKFIINDVPVESYFSPSDDVTDQIVKTIYTANASTEFALFSFTKNELGDALAWVFNNDNVAVRGLINNVNENGSEFTFLTGQGIPVGAHTAPGILHHKYMVVDALQPTSDPTVFTGSHNWSQAAESENDENSLVIHDAEIARMYRAEFEARAEENPIATHEPQRSGFQLFPNPSSSVLTIKTTDFEQDLSSARVEIWSLTGQKMLVTQLENNPEIPVADLPDGSYLVKIIASNGFAALSFQKISR